MILLVDAAYLEHVQKCVPFLTLIKSLSSVFSNFRLDEF